MPRSTRTSLAAVLVSLALAAGLAGLTAPVAGAAPAPFGLRYTVNAPGDIGIVGNTVLTCPAAAAGCAGVQGGTAVGQNNGFGMGFVDVDADPATFDSSRADLALPPGATVLFAGLYWGGKTAAGLDCSGLVQVALHAAGLACPRDTDMQEAELGSALLVNDLDGLKRGDLVFWKGHVGIMRDDKNLLHANGHHMMTVIEPLRDAVERTAAKGTPVSSIRRL